GAATGYALSPSSSGRDAPPGCTTGCFTPGKTALGAGPAWRPDRGFASGGGQRRYGNRFTLVRRTTLPIRPPRVRTRSRWLESAWERDTPGSTLKGPFMSTEQISIIIVEDEPEFRRRFAQIIESEPSMRLVGVAANKREAQAVIEKENFDVMLIDLGLPD